MGYFQIKYSFEVRIRNAISFLLRARVLANNCFIAIIEANVNKEFFKTLIGIVNIS